MKKVSLLSLAFVMMLFVNCSKDNSSDNSSNDLKPVPVTVNYDESRPAMSHSNLHELLQSLLPYKNKSIFSNSATKNIEYESGTRLITKVHISDGSLQEYYYKDKNKGLLDSIVETKNGNFNAAKKYTIDNSGHILSIETFNSTRTLIKKVEYFNYNGDKPGRANFFESNFQGVLDVSGNLTYTGDNLTGMNLSGTFTATFGNPQSVTLATQASFDNKHLPFINVETKEDAMLRVNNAISAQTVIQINNNPFTTTTTYTHQYNSDNYPISTTTSIQSVQGTNTSTLEYVYEDK